MFAADLLLFGNATKKKMSYIMEVLEAFCKCSGQRTSCDKSSILFSNNTNMHIIRKILVISNIKEKMI